MREGASAHLGVGGTVTPSSIWNVGLYCPHSLVLISPMASQVNLRSPTCCKLASSIQPKTDQSSCYNDACHAAHDNKVQPHTYTWSVEDHGWLIKCQCCSTQALCPM